MDMSNTLAFKRINNIDLVNHTAGKLPEKLKSKICVGKAFQSLSRQSRTSCRSFSSRNTNRGFYADSRVFPE